MSPSASILGAAANHASPQPAYSSFISSAQSADTISPKSPNSFPEDTKKISPGRQGSMDVTTFSEAHSPGLGTRNDSPSSSPLGDTIVRGADKKSKLLGAGSEVGPARPHVVAIPASKDRHLHSSLLEDTGKKTH
ncbi:hypothetical protein H696_01556 [Fonticula alba]|uniref:Uncharacterized protein n=1 Tax=Fonticula alba TaxID=691883 RepID=A0A058ZCP6_FONAL|nr:hypothetical protein H696_01556 [Fonticula alba]KCV72154.1 hypothetical protein H696_01556 [Fonticula alba]|eukprot:XP_009493732.1 hypothetical protein H696_01556 [Fonticula alba]